MGADLLMRSDSRFSEESTLLKQRVETDAARAAVNGEKGFMVVTDYRGEQVVSAYVPLSIQDLHWAILAEKDLEEVIQSAAHLRNYIIVAGLAVSVVVLFAAIFFARTLTKPLNVVINKVTNMAKGGANLRERLDASSADELGDLARAFNEYTDTLNAIMLDVATQSQEVAAAATEIAASAEEMSHGMSQQSEQISQITRSVEEMTSSVVEVARKSGDAANNAKESGRVAEEGRRVVLQTVTDMTTINEAVSAGAASVVELGRQGEQIGQIIGVINDIAEQTNLLALNAAIEAARAGGARTWVCRGR